MLSDWMGPKGTLPLPFVFSWARAVEDGLFVSFECEGTP